MKLMWFTKPENVNAAVEEELKRLDLYKPGFKILKETTLPNGRFRVEVSTS